MKEEKQMYQRITGYFQTTDGDILPFNMENVSPEHIYKNFVDKLIVKRIISVVAFDIGGACRVLFDYYNHSPQLHSQLFHDLNQKVGNLK